MRTTRKRDINKLFSVCCNCHTGFTIYLNTWAKNLFDLSTQDKDDLMAVALQTPYEGGEAVYTARLMLNIDPEDYYVPYRSETPGETSNYNIIRITPNPAINHVSIEIPDIENGYCMLELYSETGMLIKQTRAIAVNGLMSLSLENIKPGFYLIYLKTEKMISHCGKLVIIK